MLSLEQVTKSFDSVDGPVPVLRGVTLDVAAGETVALTGESGSGKSTLLHIAGGLETADGGSVRLDGQEVTTLNDTGRAALRRGTVGVIFQQFNLVPSLTVAANIAFQARLAGAYDAAHAEALTEALGLTSQRNKYPEALSGGQQQRVAIARCLAARPKLVLADEPTGNLDEDTAGEVLAQMRALVADTGAALMVVTHSQAVAAEMARRLHLRGGLLDASASGQTGSARAS
nr:ABC transporter ATP-binding protein [Cognatishimia sp. F0-27]